MSAKSRVAVADAVANEHTLVRRNYNTLPVRITSPSALDGNGMTRSRGRKLRLRSRGSENPSTLRLKEGRDYLGGARSPRIHCILDTLDGICRQFSVSENCIVDISQKRGQWRRQDLLRGGAKVEIMSWGTHSRLQGRMQQLLA